MPTKPNPNDTLFKIASLMRTIRKEAQRECFRLDRYVITANDKSYLSYFARELAGKLLLDIEKILKEAGVIGEFV